MPNMNPLSQVSPQPRTDQSTPFQSALQNAAETKGSEIIFETEDGRSEVIHLAPDDQVGLETLQKAQNFKTSQASISVELSNGTSVSIPVSSLTKDKLIEALKQAPQNLNPELQADFAQSAARLIQTIRQPTPGAATPAQPAEPAPLPTAPKSLQNPEALQALVDASRNALKDDGKIGSAKEINQLVNAAMQDGEITQEESEFLNALGDGKSSELVKNLKDVNFDSTQLSFGTPAAKKGLIASHVSKEVELRHTREAHLLSEAKQQLIKQVPESIRKQYGITEAALEEWMKTGQPTIDLEALAGSFNQKQQNTFGPLQMLLVFGRSVNEMRQKQGQMSAEDIKASETDFNRLEMQAVAKWEEYNYQPFVQLKGEAAKAEKDYQEVDKESKKAATALEALTKSGAPPAQIEAAKQKVQKLSGQARDLLFTAKEKNAQAKAIGQILYQDVRLKQRDFLIKQGKV
ncbi:MAG: hypothetical protein ACAI44_39090, partial [Candidatus Sericytochromatia bacterium]